MKEKGFLDLNVTSTITFVRVMPNKFPSMNSMFSGMGPADSDSLCYNSMLSHPSLRI